MKYEIRELSVGGILDQAIQVVKDHFGVLLGIASLLQIPLGIVSMIVTSMLMGDIVVQPNNPAAFENFDPSKFFVMFGVLMVLNLIVTPLTNAATVYAISDAYLGKKPTLGSAYSRALSRFFPLLGTWILLGLAIWGGLILCIVPGILCIIWFALATQVVVLEPRAGVEAMKRSKELMKDNAGKWFVLLLLLGAIGFGINMGSQLVGTLTQSIIATQVVALAGQIVASLFGAAVLVVLYFSARCTHENFDLELLATSFGESQPSESSNFYADEKGDDGI